MTNSKQYRSKLIVSLPERYVGWRPKGFIREVTVDKIRARRAITGIESSSSQP